MIYRHFFQTVKEGLLLVHVRHTSSSAFDKSTFSSSTLVRSFLTSFSCCSTRFLEWLSSSALKENKNYFKGDSWSVNMGVNVKKRHQHKLKFFLKNAKWCQQAVAVTVECDKPIGSNVCKTNNSHNSALRSFLHSRLMVSVLVFGSSSLD